MNETHSWILYPQVFPANWWGAAVMKHLPHLRSIWYCQEPSAFIHSKAWIAALPWPKNWIARILNPILKRIDLSRARQYANVLVNSEFSKAYAIKAYGYGDKQCQVVYLGVDQSRFSIPAQGDRKPWVLVVAKLTRFKNIDRVIEAIQTLVRAGNKNLHLHIVGTGDAEASLHQMVGQLGLREHVTFHGNAADQKLAELLQRSRALCLASHDEPFGLVAIEAMACGTPVVAVHSGGPKEIISGHGGGLLVPNGSSSEFASALKRIIDSEELFLSLSREALLRAGDFNWDRTVDALELIFKQGSKGDKQSYNAW